MGSNDKVREEILSRKYFHDCDCLKPTPDQRPYLSVCSLRKGFISVDIEISKLLDLHLHSKENVLKRQKVFSEFLTKYDHYYPCWELFMNRDGLHLCMARLLGEPILYDCGFEKHAIEYRDEQNRHFTTWVQKKKKMEKLRRNEKDVTDYYKMDAQNEYRQKNNEYTEQCFCCEAKHIQINKASTSIEPCLASTSSNSSERHCSNPAVEPTKKKKKKKNNRPKKKGKISQLANETLTETTKFLANIILPKISPIRVATNDPKPNVETTPSTNASVENNMQLPVPKIVYPNEEPQMKIEYRITKSSTGKSTLSKVVVSKESDEMLLNKVPPFKVPQPKSDYTTNFTLFLKNSSQQLSSLLDTNALLGAASGVVPGGQSLLTNASLDLVSNVSPRTTPQNSEVIALREPLPIPLDTDGSLSPSKDSNNTVSNSDSLDSSKTSDEQLDNLSDLGSISNISSNEETIMAPGSESSEEPLGSLSDNDSKSVVSSNVLHLGHKTTFSDEEPITPASDEDTLMATDNTITISDEGRPTSIASDEETIIISDDKNALSDEIRATTSEISDAVDDGTILALDNENMVPNGEQSISESIVSEELAIEVLQNTNNLFEDERTFSPIIDNSSAARTELLEITSNLDSISNASSNEDTLTANEDSFNEVIDEHQLDIESIDTDSPKETPVQGPQTSPEEGLIVTTENIDDCMTNEKLLGTLSDPCSLKCDSTDDGLKATREDNRISLQKLLVNPSDFVLVTSVLPDKQHNKEPKMTLKVTTTEANADQEKKNDNRRQQLEIDETKPGAVPGSEPVKTTEVSTVETNVFITAVSMLKTLNNIPLDYNAVADKTEHTYGKNKTHSEEDLAQGQDSQSGEISMFQPDSNMDTNNQINNVKTITPSDTNTSNIEKTQPATISETNTIPEGAKNHQIEPLVITVTDESNIETSLLAESSPNLEDDISIVSSPKLNQPEETNPFLDPNFEPNRFLNPDSKNPFLSSRSPSPVIHPERFYEKETQTEEAYDFTQWPHSVTLRPKPKVKRSSFLSNPPCWQLATDHWSGSIPNLTLLTRDLLLRSSKCHRRQTKKRRDPSSKF